MTRERQRIHLGPGLSIYREFLMWRLDVIIGGQRIRKTLHTHNPAQAVWLAYQALEEESSEFRALPKTVEPSKGVYDFTMPMDSQRHAVIVGGLTQYYPDAGELAEALAPLVAKEMKAVLQDEKPKAIAVPFSQAVEQYVRFQKTVEENGSEWLQNIQSTLTLFGNKMGVKTVDKISSDLLATFKGYLIDPESDPEFDPELKRPGPYRIRQIVGILKKFCKWLAKPKKYLPENPSSDLEQKKVPIIPPEFFSCEEVLEILEAAPDPETAAVFATAVYAGARREELFFLDWPDIDLDGRAITIHNRDEKSTKTGVNRQTMILDELFPYLYALPRANGRVFTRYTHVDPFGDNIIRLCESVTRKEGVGLGTARHTALTWWIKHGVSPGTAADLAANSPKVIERHYRGRVPLNAKALSMKYFGFSLVPTGIPQVSEKQRAAWTKSFLASISNRK